jgi:hypothetical protein
MENQDSDSTNSMSLNFDADIITCPVVKPYNRKNRIDKLEKQEKARKNFILDFIINLKTTLANTQIVVISLGTGYSDAKKNNKKAIQELIKPIINEGRKTQAGDEKNNTILCFKKSADNLHLDEFGDSRTRKLNRVIFNFMNTKGRYVSVLKEPESILRYTNQVIIFVPRKIPEYLKPISDKVTVKHFILLQQCKLIEISLESSSICNTSLKKPDKGGKHKIKRQTKHMNELNTLLQSSAPKRRKVNIRKEDQRETKIGLMD